MLPYDQTPSLEEICSVFSYNANEISFFCVQLWAWDKAITKNEKEKAQCHM
jgi:hypothetical protein